VRGLQVSTFQPHGNRQPSPILTPWPRCLRRAFYCVSFPRYTESSKTNTKLLSVIQPVLVHSPRNAKRSIGRRATRRSVATMRLPTNHSGNLPTTRHAWRKWIVGRMLGPPRSLIACLSLWIWRTTNGVATKHTCMSPLLWAPSSCFLIQP